MKTKLAALGIAVLLVVGCASGPSGPQYANYYVRDNGNDVSSSVSYTMPDAQAFALVVAWAAQTFDGGRDSILVEDSANGILAGKEKISGNDGGNTRELDYRVLVQNGVATLKISGIHTSGRVYATSQEDANKTARWWITNAPPAIVGDFGKIFE